MIQYNILVGDEKVKKAIIYQKEECVIIKTITIADKHFAFFVAVNSKKVIYLKESIVHGEITYVSLEKLVHLFPQYQSASIFNIKVILDTFVNTINYKIHTGAISDSDEILEMIYQFEKIINDPYIKQMTDERANLIFNKQAMFEVTNTIKKLDGKYKKTNLSDLLKTNEEKGNDVFLSQNWLEETSNKDIVYQSILNSNKAHKRSIIDFLFNNRVLNIYMIVMVVAVVGFASCFMMLDTWKSTGSDSEDEIEEILEEALIEDPVERSNEEIGWDVVDPTENKSNVTSNKTSNKTSNASSNVTSKYGSDYSNYANVSMVNVDFNKLKKINRDTVAWIYVNNTNINYPVVQTTNNSYYLNHSFRKKSNVAGWIYGDYRSDFKNFKRNTVLYGHGRTDQVMFGSLTKTLEKSWQQNKQNQIIKMSTPTNDTLWQIVSIYVIPAEAYYLTHNFENDAAYQKWIDKMISRSKYNFGVKATTKDKFLTLSTCKDYNGNRIVVQAKLVKNVKK